jgi:hypothetical protein
MSRRNEHSRRHGHWDPRWYTPKATHQDGVDVIAGHDSTRGEARSVAFRHELCDRHGNYVGTFVTKSEHWQIGDAFTSGNGEALRIIGVTAPEQSSDRPAFTDRWNVEPHDADGSAFVLPAGNGDADVGTGLDSLSDRGA